MITAISPLYGNCSSSLYWWTMFSRKRTWTYRSISSEFFSWFFIPFTRHTVNAISPSPTCQQSLSMIVFYLSKKYSIAAWRYTKSVSDCIPNEIWFNRLEKQRSSQLAHANTDYQVIMCFYPNRKGHSRFCQWMGLFRVVSFCYSLCTILLLLE